MEKGLSRVIRGVGDLAFFQTFDESPSWQASPGSQDAVTFF
ncbi:MAG: hypothetical protein ABI720_10115 [Actinomycetes bacterium]